MTTDIRDTLHDIGTSVAPPPVDRGAFDRRVRRVRRSRRLARAAVATAGVAAAGVAAWLVAPGGNSGQPDLVTDRPTGDLPASSPEVLAFAQHDRLFLSTPDSPMLGVDTGIGVEEIVARVPDGVVYLDDVLHRRDLGSDTDLGTSPLPRGAMVWDVGVDRWVSWQDGSLELHTDEASYDIEPYFHATEVELAGNTMAVVTDDGTEVWSAVTGQRLQGSLGGSTAALSPDGRWVASGANDLNLDDGMSHGLWLADTRKDRVRDVRFGDDTGPVTDIWWADDQRFFVVVSTNAAGQLLHTLYECTVEGGCHTRIEDESGTLELPKD